eukprot:10640018-Alexandrium_andersonii.AAC.1
MVGLPKASLASPEFAAQISAKGGLAALCDQGTFRCEIECGQTCGAVLFYGAGSMKWCWGGVVVVVVV